MEEITRRIEKLEKSQEANVEGILSKILQMANSKSVPFYRDQAFEQLLNLKIVALESKHPKAGYFSAVFRALREKMSCPDDSFKKYLLALLGDKDQEKVLDRVAKVENQIF